MPFIRFAAGEKRLLLAALVAACLVGGVAGYIAYLDEAEAQFHGGVLEENRAEAEWALIWEPTRAFARWAGGIAFIFGVVPVGVRRMFSGRSR
jgi:hypothetical protein